MVAGGLTGAINILIVFPTEFIKTQLQLDTARAVYYPKYTDYCNHHDMTMTQLMTFRYSMLCEKLTPQGTVVSGNRLKTYSGSADVVRQTVRQRGAVLMYCTPVL